MSLAVSSGGEICGPPYSPCNCAIGQVCWCSHLCAVILTLEKALSIPNEDDAFEALQKMYNKPGKLPLYGAALAQDMKAQSSDSGGRRSDAHEAVTGPSSLIDGVTAAEEVQRCMTPEGHHLPCLYQLNGSTQTQKPTPD